MPVVLRIKGYKFWFYEADLNEPPHVHIGKDGKEAKVWLDHVTMVRTGKFKAVEQREIERIISDNLEFLMTAWKMEQTKRANS